MKWYTSLSINLLFSLSVLFIPKIVLFPIVRMYADLKFHVLTKKYKSVTGKQKYNLFVERCADSANALRISEDRIAKVNRKMERSLRTFVMDNRKQMKPAITDEEKGLQILAQGQ